MASELTGGQTDEGAVLSRRLGTPGLLGAAVVVAGIYLARDVLLPLSTAMLITFALSPMATRLRRLGLPQLPAVLVVVVVAFIVIGLFVLVVTSQLGSLAANLPSFQSNILAKVESIKQAGSGNSLVTGLARMVAVITDEIGAARAAQSVPGVASPPIAAIPLPVEVVETLRPFALLRDLVLPLISPIAMIGLVIVVVIFMLLEREDLRDRFIKLVGSTDLHRTTQVLQ
jgi:predicted PurR-regulated permease PerM